MISVAPPPTYPLGMPRSVRLDAPLALQHVWDRGIERSPIFLDDADRLDFLTRIADLVHAKHFAVYAWALMSNHFHLLTRTGNLGLSSCMQILLGDYAAASNGRHQRCGHLFQNRFKSAMVEEDAYFLELVRYIHLNPLRAGIVTDLDTLDRYRWTGHATLLGHQVVPWQDTTFVLMQFGPNHAQARAAYRAFIGDGIVSTAPDLDGGGLRRSRGLWEHLKPIRRGREAWSFDERILGRSNFVRSVLDELNGTQAPHAHDVDAAQFVDHVTRQLARRTGLQLRELCSNSKRPRVVQARQALCYLAICHAALPARQVALRLGLHPSTVLRNAAAGDQALDRLGCAPLDLLPAAVGPT